MGLFGRTRRPPAWLFGLLGVIVTGGFAFATFQIWSNDNALLDHGQQAQARVVGVHKGKSGRTQVEFRTPDGRQVRSLIGQGDQGPDVQLGDELTIVYDPQDPASDVSDTRAANNHTFAYLMLGLTIVTGTAVSFVLWRIRRHERQKT